MVAFSNHWKMKVERENQIWVMKHMRGQKQHTENMD